MFIIFPIFLLLEKDNNAWKSDIRNQYLTVMTFDTLGGSLKKQNYYFFYTCNQFKLMLGLKVHFEGEEKSQKIEL